MKFYKSDLILRNETPCDVETAVAHVVHMASYGTEGAIENAVARADKTQEMFARLLGELIDAGMLKAEQVDNILQTSYVTVEN